MIPGISGLVGGCVTGQIWSDSCPSASALLLKMRLLAAFCLTPLPLNVPVVPTSYTHTWAIAGDFHGIVRIMELLCR